MSNLSLTDSLRLAEEGRRRIREQSDSTSAFWSKYEPAEPELTPEERQAETALQVFNMGRDEYAAARSSLGVTGGDWGQRASTPEELRAAAAALRGPEPDPADAYQSIIKPDLSEFGPGTVAASPRKNESPFPYRP